MKLSVIPISIGVLASIWTLTAPSSALAHKVINTEMIRSSDTQAAFIVTFQLGFLNREARVSALASRNSNTRDTNIAYELVRPDGSVVTTGRTEAIVLSGNAALDKAGEYHIPSRKNRTFTLLTVFDSETPLPKDTALAIKELPLTLIKADGTATRFTIPSEDLAAYRTKP